MSLINNFIFVFFFYFTGIFSPESILKLFIPLDGFYHQDSNERLRNSILSTSNSSNSSNQDTNNHDKPAKKHFNSSGIIMRIKDFIIKAVDFVSFRGKITFLNILILVIIFDF